MFACHPRLVRLKLGTLNLFTVAGWAWTCNRIYNTTLTTREDFASCWLSKFLSGSSKLHIIYILNPIKLVKYVLHSIIVVLHSYNDVSSNKKKASYFIMYEVCIMSLLPLWLVMSEISLAPKLFWYFFFDIEWSSNMINLCFNVFT